MKILLSLLLGANLLTAPILSESSVEIETEEQIPTEEETTENTEEKQELEELIVKWLNGEIELDEETLEKIKKQLEPEIDKILQDYIADNEERQLVTSIIMGIITGLGLLVIMFLYTRKIVKANNTANDNNAKFSKTSKQIKDSAEILTNQVSDLKVDYQELKEIVMKNVSEVQKSEEIVNKVLEILSTKLDGVAGILKIAYENEGEVGANENKEETPSSK